MYVLTEYNMSYIDHKSFELTTGKRLVCQTDGVLGHDFFSVGD